MVNCGGFTLIEVMVALGLTVVLLVAMAQVFSISRRVVYTAETQSRFYANLAAAHSWMSDKFLCSKFSDGAATLSASPWTAQNSASVPSTLGGSVFDFSLSAGSGVLLTTLRSFTFSEAANTSATKSNHRLYSYKPFKLLYCDGREGIVSSGPEQTLEITMNLYFTDNHGNPLP